MQIILISSVVPTPTSGGEIVLYRHLHQLEFWDVTVVPKPVDNIEGNFSHKLMARLSRTRFHPFVKDWEVILEVLRHDNYWDKNLDIHGSQNKTSIVLTVAHGDGCWAAQRFAQKHKLPLVTIFHDWWPDFIISLHQPVRHILERRFRQLYRRSSLALCVSEGMKNALGSHGNSQVLYPIPELLEEELAAKSKIESDKVSSLLRVLYSGNLYNYGPMLAQLLQVTKDHPQVQAQVRGSNPNWSIAFREEMKERNLWLDFAPRHTFNKWLAAADAFLITMSFEPALQRRMETSFPSKLLEYAQFGKPLVIWGPPSCSAIQWGQTRDRALCITDENPQAVVSALEMLKNSPDQQGYYAKQSKIAAQTKFNPILIQKQFLYNIHKLVIIGVSD